MTPLTDVRLMLAGARFLGGLPAFLRHRLSAQDAAETLARSLRTREQDFLARTRRAVFDHPPSPYRQLFKLAGCEYGDLVRLVVEEGVEGALRNLFRHGVYLTVDEFKGRRQAIRGNMALAVTPESLRNPLAAVHLPARTSGSRSAGTPILFDLAFVRDCAVHTCLFLHARGGDEWVKAVWETPGAGARFRLLKYSAFGATPYWFTQISPDAPQLDPMFRWSERALRWGSRLAGFPLPAPQHVPLTDPVPLSQWVAGVLQSGNVPHLFTFPSSALLLCQAAMDAVIDLSGAQFPLAGEPITEARLKVIRRAGAEALPRYGSMECGPIGYGCLRPDAVDDVHVLRDLHALIQPDPQDAGSGRPAQPLYVSSLHPRAPFIMLNVAMGDQAVMAERSCGCPLEQLGWTIHLREIRSYEKLTGAGVTFLDTDVIRVLEEVLPARFGGTPMDYQLLEEEAGDGHPRLRLLVHPRLGPLNERTVRDTLLSRLGTGSPVARIMEQLWRDIDILTLERRPPLATASGKILHFHSSTRPQAVGSATAR